MRVIEMRKSLASQIEPFESSGARAMKLGEGTGTCHVHAVCFDSPGEIGPHEAGFDPLFVVVEGSGQGAGPDGVRVALATGRAASARRGEVPSKGSDEGLTAIKVQVGDLGGPPTRDAG